MIFNSGSDKCESLLEYNEENTKHFNQISTQINNNTKNMQTWYYASTNFKSPILLIDNLKAFEDKFNMKYVFEDLRKVDGLSGFV